MSIYLQERGFKIKETLNTIQHIETAPGTHFLGRFLNGQVVGHFWIGLINSGYIHGVADEHGLATGDDLAFIYQDGETALKGQFENKYMRKAKNVNVKKYGCDDNGMFIATEFTEPLSSHEFFYDPCTNESFGGGSKELEDPYEVKTVRLAPSSVPNSGEGVFLKKDIPKWRPACFYSLYLYRAKDQEQLYRDQCSHNISKSDIYRRNSKKYSIPLKTYDATIDLPPEFDNNPLPNLGPKVNHHFKLANSAYLETEHPRWGLIHSVTAIFWDLKAGEELFTNYNYGRFDFPEDFPWYWETKIAIEREERLKKEGKK